VIESTASFEQQVDLYRTRLTTDPSYLGEKSPESVSIAQLDPNADNDEPPSSKELGDKGTALLGTAKSSSSRSRVKRPRETTVDEPRLDHKRVRKQQRIEPGSLDITETAISVEQATPPRIDQDSASHGAIVIPISEGCGPRSLSDPDVIDLTEDLQDPATLPIAIRPTDSATHTESIHDPPIVIHDSEPERSPTSSPVIITRKRNMPRKSNRVINSPPVSAGPSGPAHRRSGSDSSLSDAPPTSQPAPLSPPQGDAAAPDAVLGPAPTTKIKLKIGSGAAQTSAQAVSSPGEEAAPAKGRAGQQIGGAKRKEPVNSAGSSASGRAAKKAKAKNASEEADIGVPAGDVDMGAALQSEPAPSKGRGSAKGTKAESAAAKGAAKKGAPAGNATVDDLISDVLPSSPAGPSPSTQVAGKQRNARPRRGKAAQSETLDSEPDFSSSPSVQEPVSVPDSPAAPVVDGQQQPTPVPAPHADPTPPASQLASPMPNAAGPSKASDLAKSTLKKSAAAAKSKGKARASPSDPEAGAAAGVKGDANTSTPARKVGAGVGASASTGKKPINATISTGALGTPKAGVRTGLVKSASAVGLGASLNGSPAPGAAVRPAPRQSLLAATLAKADAPAAKVDDKQRVSLRPETVCICCAPMS
jgi:hypothetical protein